jgi:hypothetical protein
MGLRPILVLLDRRLGESSSRRARVRIPLFLLLPFLVFFVKSLRNELCFQPDGTARAAFGIYDVSEEHWHYTNKAHGVT